jgi:hypothetical protein
MTPKVGATKNKINWTTLKLKTFVHQRTLLSWRYRSVVQHVLSVHKALGLTPVPPKIKILKRPYQTE